MDRAVPEIQGQRLAAPRGELGNGAEGGARAREAEALREACQSFESFFAYYLLQVMGKSVTSKPLFGSSMESEWYRGMLYEKVGEAIGRRGELGIAKTLYESLALRLEAGSGEGTRRRGEAVLDRVP